MMTQYYNICELKKNNTHQFAWIPSEFANLGNFVKIKVAGSWEDGWEVIKVGQKQDEHKIGIIRDQHRNMRKMTDI